MMLEIEKNIILRVYINMPRRKQGYFRRFYNKTKGRGGMVLNNPVAMAGVRALKMASGIRRMLNVEYKDLVHNDGGVPITPSTTGDIRAIGGININSGTGSNQRTGRSVKLTSWYARFFINFNSAAASTNLRIMLVKDNQVNQALPAISDVLEDVSVLGLMNRDNGKRFKVLFDKTYSANSFITSQQERRHFTKYKKLNMHVKYDGTGGGIADITDNELYLICISDEVTNTPSIFYRARVKYVDN